MTLSRFCPPVDESGLILTPSRTLVFLLVYFWVLLPTMSLIDRQSLTHSSLNIKKVHSPDGAPCGLLSHLALLTKIICYPDTAASHSIMEAFNTGGGKGEQSSASTNSKTANKRQWLDLDDLLLSLGVSPAGVGGQSGEGRARATYSDLVVCLDGRVIGSAPPSLCKTIAALLRKLKVEDEPKIPTTLEVALIPAANVAGAPYPGLYLFTGAARLVRPVLQRATGKTEMIGPLEQAFMDIACLEEDIREGITTHQELNPTNMLSLIANMTPFSDQNQAPRNIYQCQMGKQVRIGTNNNLSSRIS